MRNKALAVVSILSPLILLVIIVFLQWLSDSLIESWEILDPPAHDLRGIELIPMIKFGYTHGETDWSNYIIQYIQNIGPHIKILSYPELNQTEFMEESIAGYNNNISVLFCTEYIEIGIDKYDCILPNATDGSMIYNIIYNYTYPSEYLKQDYLQYDVLLIKLLIDNAYLEYQSNYIYNSTFSIEADVQSFPIRDRGWDRYNVMTSGGPGYLIITSFSIYALIVLEIVKEKYDFIKIYLELSGSKQSNYWLSWILVGFFISFLCALITPAIGLLFSIPEFSNIPYLLVFLLFFLLHCCFVMIGALSASLISSKKLAYTVTFSFILSALVIQAFICNSVMIKFINLDDSSWWVIATRYILQIYPPYNYAVIFYRLFAIAGWHFSTSSYVWENGRLANWDDVLIGDSGKLFGTPYLIPACINNYLSLFGFILISIIFLIYFDLVIPNNRARKL